MELYQEIVENFTTCKNIHYVNQDLAYSIIDEVAHNDTKDGILNSYSIKLFNSSICVYKNNLISILRNNKGVFHLYHFSEKQLDKIKTNYIELRCVLKGSLCVEVNGEKVIVHEGELLIISENSIHVDILDESDSIVLNFTIHNKIFNEAFFEKVNDDPLQQFIKNSIFSFKQHHGYLVFKSKDESIKRKFYELMQNIYHETNDRYPGYVDVCVGYLVRLFYFVSTYYSVSAQKEYKSMYMYSLFRSVDQFIKENLCNITIDSLASAFGYYPDFFNRLIKKFTGLTYSNYVIMLRIEKAKKLLATTDKTIEEIVWECGYSNKGFFFKKFKEKEKCSPSEYRKSVYRSNDEINNF